MNDVASRKHTAEFLCLASTPPVLDSSLELHSALCSLELERRARIVTSRTSWTSCVGRPILALFLFCSPFSQAPPHPLHQPPHVASSARWRSVAASCSVNQCSSGKQPPTPFARHSVAASSSAAAAARRCRHASATHVAPCRRRVGATSRSAAQCANGLRARDAGSHAGASRRTAGRSAPHGRERHGHSRPGGLGCRSCRRECGDASARGRSGGAWSASSTPARVCAHAAASSRSRRSSIRVPFCSTRTPAATATATRIHPAAIVLRPLLLCSRLCSRRLAVSAVLSHVRRGAHESE